MLRKEVEKTSAFSNASKNCADPKDVRNKHTLLSKRVCETILEKGAQLCTEFLLFMARSNWKFM